MSPASETRASKRLMPGSSGRSGVIQTMRTSTRHRAAIGGRLLRHPADGLLGDPEPDLVAVGVELGPEPEGLPVRLPAGLERGQDPRAAGPVLAPACDDDRQLAVGHAGQLFTMRGVIGNDSSPRQDDHDERLHGFHPVRLLLVEVA